MAVQLANATKPASGGEHCACPRAVCEPWCTCDSCDSRPEALCYVKMGTSFGDMVCEMVETLSADKCGEHVLTRTHHDSDGALILVFDVPAGAGPAALQPVPND